ncbi:glycoside hydrolase family 2 TIM barrel-domain containing protein [Aristaeella hokkaidonensis]|uniref:DUF4982 domain-containing protein n=1 Tax=Aristaeella hokkaidonensis TaxID=3046382 RepID=A0AC61N7Y4_9FIRM|nr:glycoside hydrolase family 2 TIM barrel-domain containing protein [Aristaeella hokkaidonensis]QUC68071.1 DUF4982 domain-containing protein [Aristaeella hokkaidonensis]SNT93143.1 beta-galactosidase [Aristaeella hokkaidonensis]
MRTLINDQWFFAKLPAGSGLKDAEKASFTPVDLPHDWLIWQDDLYETADAWYRRIIELPEDHEPVVMIRFDGVYMDCDVLLNGEVLCTHPYGYTAFDVPLDGKLQAGRNELMVHIRHRSPNSRWYSGSGIYRDVYLVTLPASHLIPDGLSIKENYTDEQGWNLRIKAETAGEPQPFECVLQDMQGETAGIAAGKAQEGFIRATIPVREGRPWSPEDPYLYTLNIRYGKQTEVRKIGLRSVFADPNQGLFLNGQKTRLRGVCLHHDLGALGAAFHEKAARRQLKLMKDMGVNAVRTSHNPPAEKWLDMCDEMGILVVDEAFDMWERPKTTYDYARFFPEWYQRDVASWIRRDRCHACVIMWSIGNEIYDMHADERGTAVTQLLADEVRKHDPEKHAYVTFGCNYMQWEGGQRCAERVDIVGYNYGEKLYEAHHAAHPKWIIYGSETGSILSSRGIYHFPMSQSIMSDADLQCSALGNSNTSWGADSLKRLITEDLHHSFSLGQFIWSGIDYIGEPTPYHTRSCYFGQADTACFPKDSYYLFKSFWNPEKMIHIGVNWDWNPGQLIDIPVMTNCYETELFLNGKSCGKQKPDYSSMEKCLPVWQLPFRPGTLTARGYDEKGQILCEESIRTPGETAQFSLTREEEKLKTDGWDLAFVTVSAEDRDGNPIGNARDRIKITVRGGGQLIGTDNGDSTDPDSYQCDCRRLFSGKLLLIIRSNGKHEDVSVLVRSSNGICAEMTIPVEKAEMKKGISCIQKAAEKPLTGGVPARRLEIRAIGSTRLTEQNPECSFEYRVLPADAGDMSVTWEVTNAAGIASPYVKITGKNHRITVRAEGDGKYYLRGLCGRQADGCEFISQMEFSAEGTGNPSLDPFTYVSAGLYDLHEGNIGTGNEKGIAFDRNGESMIGFSRVDFGKTGSDTVTADIFALNDDPYDLEMWTCGMNGTEHLTAVLHYEKKSIWNVYQPETWKLPERLTGLQTMKFRMKDKVHMKGFVFEKQLNAYIPHTAGSAEQLYGDCFERSGSAVTHIGNNVTLTWTDMDFGGEAEVTLEIEGETPLDLNTISIRIVNKEGKEYDTAAGFSGKGGTRQRFSVRVPEGSCTVSFVFLPGSAFDFRSFRFYRQTTGQT